MLLVDIVLLNFATGIVMPILFRWILGSLVFGVVSPKGGGKGPQIMPTLEFTDMGVGSGPGMVNYSLDNRQYLKLYCLLMSSL